MALPKVGEWWEYDRKDFPDQKCFMHVVRVRKATKYHNTKYHVNICSYLKDSDEFGYLSLCDGWTAHELEGMWVKSTPHPKMLIRAAFEIADPDKHFRDYYQES
jgi:hypothetical protein